MFDPNDVFVGNKVRCLRASARISITEVARLMGISQEKLRLIESGADRAGPWLLELLADLLGVSVWSFFDADADAHLDLAATVGPAPPPCTTPTETRH